MSNIRARGARREVKFPKTPKFPLNLSTARLQQKEAAHDILTLRYKGAMKRSLKRPVKHGDPVEFHWSYGATQGSFYGYVHTIEKRNHLVNPYTTIVCISNSSVMKKSHKKIFKNKTASEIVQFIAKRYNYKVTVTPSIKKYKKLSQSGHTDWQLLRQMAKATGYALRVENLKVTFKSRDTIISQRLKSAESGKHTAPAFLHLPNAPKGLMSLQTLISFTALDGQTTPEYDQGDSGIVMYGRDGTKYTFDSGFNLTTGQDKFLEPVKSPYDWTPAATVTTGDMIEAIDNAGPSDPEKPAGAYDITNYGASQNSNDNIDAIQATLNAAGAAAGVGNIKYVYVPEGTWNIRSTESHRLEMKSYVYFKVHPKATIKNYGDSHLMVTSPSYDNTGYNGLRYATIDGGIWDSTLNGKGISIVHSSNVTIKNLSIRNTVGKCHGIEINSSEYFIVDNCSLLGVRKTTAGDIKKDPTLSERLGKPKRDHDEAIQVDYAWDLAAPHSGNDKTHCQYITIQNCYFGPSGMAGSTNYPRAIGTHNAKLDAYKHQHINILNNTIDGCVGKNGGAIRVYNMDHVLVQGNKISNSFRAINAYIEPKHGTCLTGMDDIQIKDNIIDNCGSWKTHGDDGDNWHGINLSVGKGSSATFTNVVISGNQITNHHGSSCFGIRVVDCASPQIKKNYVPNRHCGTDQGNMISASSKTNSGTITVSKNTPDNS